MCTHTVIYSEKQHLGPTGCLLHALTVVSKQKKGGEDCHEHSFKKDYCKIHEVKIHPDVTETSALFLPFNECSTAKLSVREELKDFAKLFLGLLWRGF